MDSMPVTMPSDISPYRLLPGETGLTGLDRLGGERWNTPEMALLGRLSAFPGNFPPSGALAETGVLDAHFAK